MTQTFEHENTEVGLAVVSHLSSGACTDVGQKREENQDSFGIIEAEETILYIVADGMGGVKGGAIASKLAIQVFSDSLNGNFSSESYRAAVKEANTRVFQHGQSDTSLAGMGTTFVGLCFSGRELYVLNVGDSRAYRIRENQIEQLTHDHTLVQELVDSGALAPEQAEGHPVSHMLTRSLGPSSDVEPDCVLLADGPIAGDRFVLCSDGLYNHVESEEIAPLIESYTDQEAAQVLVDTANERGGSDNITVIVITVKESCPVTRDDYPQALQEVSTSAETQELRRGDLQRSIRPNDPRPDLSNSHSPEMQSSVSLEEKAAQSAQEQKVESTAEFHQDFVNEEPVAPEETPSPKGSTSKVAMVAALAAATTILTAVIANQGSRHQIASVKEVASSTVVTTGEKQEESSQLELKEENILSEEGIVFSTIGKSSNESVVKGQSRSLTGTNEVTHQALAVRREFLQNQIEMFEKHIALIDRPFSGEFGDSLKNLPKTRKSLKSSLREIRAAMDIATRRLATWYGRKRRLEASDPLTLSIEVSATSADVARAKQAFDEVTWEYLKQAEALQYDPENQKLKAELLFTRKERQARLGAVSQAISKAVTGEIHRSDEEITKLTLERERIEDSLRMLDREEDIVKIITSGAPEKRERLRQRLEQDLSVVRSELSELG